MKRKETEENVEWAVGDEKDQVQQMIDFDWKNDGKLRMEGTNR